MSTSEKTLSGNPSVSLTILRERGPMNLRDLARETAKRMGCRLMYADVAGVMQRHLELGEALRERHDDYRNDVWAAV